MSTSKQPSFASQYEKLEEILEWFEGDQFDLGMAEDKFSEGMKLAEQLIKRINSAKLQVKKLGAKPGKTTG